MSHPALAYLTSHQYEEGAAFCEQAIAEVPDNPADYWYLGLIRLLRGDAAEAQAIWFSALTMIAPASLDAEMHGFLQILYREAERQLQIGNAYLAERIYQQLLELDSTQAFAYLQLGIAASLQGKLDEAIASWQTATQLDPNLAEAYIQQAEVWQKLEQWSEAILAYSQAIDLQPTTQLRYHLGVCWGQCYQWSAAIEQFNQVLYLQPNFAPAYSDRGWAYLQLNQWSPATRDFQAALQTHSHYAQTYNNWVEQLQQANLPIPEALRQNANQLHRLCEASEQAWQHWIERPMATPANPAPSEPLSGDPPPTGYILNTETWAATQPSVPYVKLDSASSIALRPPKTCERSLHFSFRLEHEIPLPETFVVTLPDGHFWLKPDQSSNAILTASNELLGDLSPEFPLLTPGHPDKHPSHHSILQRTTLPPAQPIPGTVAVLAGLTNDMYFHWLFDVLPRFDLLLRSGIDLDQIDYFLVSSHLPFQQETLELLNIPPSKILETNQNLHIQADNLVVPSYPSSPAWMPERVCHWLQNLVLGVDRTAQKKCDRLYITRQQASNRRVINELEIIEYLQPFGFQSVALESLSVQEQAHLLASTKVVISAHGSGLTNFTFCQPGTKVIEIFSPNFVYPCYWLVSNLLNLDYYYLTGIIPTGYYLHQQLYPNPRTEDILVNLDDLKYTLQLAEIT
ncbi:MAG: glycosyltransferase 61 family protein [Leptolyngbyaceae cyanobacterium bins.302]|nr:glycosyltransferase 61 family protein [Leptolyngbyaceae cyanobacterium bins.302]